MTSKPLRVGRPCRPHAAIRRRSAFCTAAEKHRRIARRSMLIATLAGRRGSTSTHIMTSAYGGGGMVTRAAGSRELDTEVLLQTLAAFKAGDFSARLPETWTGVAGKIADSLNDV